MDNILTEITTTLYPCLIKIVGSYMDLRYFQHNFQIAEKKVIHENESVLITEDWITEQISHKYATNYVFNSKLGKKSCAIVVGNANGFSNNFVLTIRLNALVPNIFDTIEYISLEIGGVQIDGVYGNVMDVLCAFHGLECKVTRELWGVFRYEIPIPMDILLRGRAIPLFGYHESKIIVSMNNIDNKEIKIVKDSVVTCDQYNLIPSKPLLLTGYNISHTAISFTGPYSITEKGIKIRRPLLCHQDVYAIIVFFLDVNEKLIADNIISRIKITSNKYKSIKNFSQIDNFPGRYLVRIDNKFNSNDSVINIKLKEHNKHAQYLLIYGLRKAFISCDVTRPRGGYGFYFFSMLKS